MRIGAALWVFLVALTGAVAYGEPQATASVDQREVTVGAPFTLKIRIRGQNVGEVTLPGRVDGLEIQPNPIFNNFSMRIGPGVRTQEVERGYRVHATREGTFTIPPIGVEVDGTTVKTEPLEIVAKPNSSSASGSSAGIGPPSTAGNRLTLGDAVFVTSTVDKTDVYEGEAVRLTLEVWQLDVDAVNVEAYRNEIEPPNTQGFYAVPRTPAPSAVVPDVRNGRRYMVSRYHQTLYPMRTGTLTIGRWDWQGGVHYLSASGIQVRDLDLHAAPIDLHVKSLPGPKPAGFSGAVGRFQFHGDVTSHEVAMGVPVKLVIRVVGEGNPGAIGEPVMPPVDGARISDPQKEVRPIQDGRGVGVEKNFIYTVSPTRPGHLTVPALSFTYFDPTSIAYKTEKAGPFDIEVGPSTESMPRVTVDAATPHSGSLGDDVRTIATRVGTLRPRPSALLVWPAVLAGPALAYAALALIIARRRRFEKDVSFARGYHARSKGRRRLEAVETSTEPTEELYRALIGFLADKFNVPAAGMTSGDAARLLEAHGVNGDLEEGIVKILRSCERARYGGSELSAEEIRALTHAAIVGVDSVEARLRKAGG